MDTIKIKDSNKNMDKLLEKINKDNKPIKIINDQNQMAVLISEKTWYKVKPFIDVLLEEPKIDEGAIMHPESGMRCGYLKTLYEEDDD